MPRYVPVTFDAHRNANVNGAGSNYVVETLSGVLYIVYIDGGDEVSFRKSTDRGLSWSKSTALFSGTGTTNIAVWYDRWSGIAADLIHVAYTDSGIDDVLYRTIDTASSDTLSTQTTVFAGASTANGGAISLTRARGGNVYCKVCIDAGAEGGFFRLPNANVPSGAWDAARTNTEALATQDQFILAPGFAADNQDIMCIFWDASANQISRYVYDDSANSWAESIFTGTFTDVPAQGATYPHFDLAVDLDNSQLIVVAWNAVDAANQDLTCWTVTESAITAKTDVVTNATDDCGLAAISLDTSTGYWWAYFCGNPDGSETWNTAINVYCKVSTDQGSTWGALVQLTSTPRMIGGIWTSPRAIINAWTGVLAQCGDDANNAAFFIVDVVRPRMTHQIGM